MAWRERTGSFPDALLMRLAVLIGEMHQLGWKQIRYDYDAQGDSMGDTSTTIVKDDGTTEPLEDGASSYDYRAQSVAYADSPAGRASEIFDRAIEAHPTFNENNEGCYGVIIIDRDTADVMARNNTRYEASSETWSDAKYKRASQDDKDRCEFSHAERRVKKPPHNNPTTEWMWSHDVNTPPVSELRKMKGWKIYWEYTKPDEDVQVETDTISYVFDDIRNEEALDSALVPTR